MAFILLIGDAFCLSRLQVVRGYGERTVLDLALPV